MLAQISRNWVWRQKEIPIVPGIRRRIINLNDADLETRDPGRAPELVEGTFVQNFNGVVQSKFSDIYLRSIDA